MLKRTIVRVVLPLAAAGSLLGGTAATVAERLRLSLRWRPAPRIPASCTRADPPWDTATALAPASSSGGPPGTVRHPSAVRGRRHQDVDAGTAMTDAGCWRKASRSTGGDCVEVGSGWGVIRVRDSRNPGGPVLAFTPRAWQLFV